MFFFNVIFHYWKGLFCRKNFSWISPPSLRRVKDLNLLEVLNKALPVGEFLAAKITVFHFCRCSVYSSENENLINILCPLCRQSSLLLTNTAGYTYVISSNASILKKKFFWSCLSCRSVNKNHSFICLFKIILLLMGFCSLIITSTALQVNYDQLHTRELFQAPWLDIAAIRFFYIKLG